MKYILILLISFSFAQVPILPIGMGEKEHKVTWCVREEISDPCPDMWTIDEFGRDVFYGCLVYHFHIEYDCDNSKYFDSYEEAEKFAKKAIEESDISKVKLNGTLIPKPKVEWINVDVDSISLTSADTSLLSVSIATTIAETEIDASKIITCLLNHPAGYNCDYGKTTSESYEHMLQRIDAEYDRLHPRERVVTVGDYLDYAEECYNDSVHIYDIPNPSTFWYIEEVGEYVTGKDTLYFPTTPTLAGFIEWIQR